MRLGGYLVQTEWSNRLSACVIAPPIKGIGPWDLARTDDLVIASALGPANARGLLIYRPGFGAAALLKWQAGDVFQTIFIHPEATGANVGIGPWDLKRSVDRVIAADVDGDGRDEFLIYRPGFGACALIQWRRDDVFQTIFQHPEAAGMNVGVGPWDLKRTEDLVVAADVDGDGRDELLIYRPGFGAAALLKWQAGDVFQTIFIHPEATGANVGIGPWDLKRSVDRVIAADVDGDGKDEFLIYRPGFGACALIKWQRDDVFQTIFIHPDA